MVGSQSSHVPNLFRLEPNHSRATRSANVCANVSRATLTLFRRTCEGCWIGSPSWSGKLGRVRAELRGRSALPAEA